MHSAAMGASDNAPSPRFGERLKAWWNGVDLARPPARRPPPDLATQAPEKPLPAVKLEEWENAALKAKQAIWGEGFHRPGGEEFILELVKPFALNNTMSVLDFGCGMGGGTRSISRVFDVWLTGVERDAALAHAGKELSKRAGLERKAEINAYKAEEFVSRPGGFDCILSIEALHEFEQREILISRLENALKTRGQIMITEFTLGGDVAGDHPALLAAFGRETPALWSHGEYEKRFKELNVDLRVSEDITERYRAMAMASLTAVPIEPVTIATARALPEAMIAEVESWARRIAAIDQGVLKVRRFYGIKLGASKMMSDWS